MAEQIARDVVKEAQSVGNFLPSDNIAKPTNTTTAGDGTQPPTNVNATENSPKTPTTSSNVGDSEGSERSTAQHAADYSATSASETTQGHKEVGSNVTNGMTNGVSDEHHASEDTPLQNATTDASGGSDSDTIAKDAAKGHVRTGSVKKPTFFKSSSVTKNFLAKTANPAPPTAGNKALQAPNPGISPSQASAKPRLVAKSGSGLGNLSRSSLTKANGAGNGPDASKVWNKNQPVPPPPPKQFTDEELKQQYGIHMATRLQADDASKDQSKWADIDDDEDDWAPETVEWMDGTKSTVAVTENAPPAEVIKPVLLKQTKPITTEAAPAPTTQAKAPIAPTPTAAAQSTAAPLASTPAPVVSTIAPAVQKPTSTGGVKTILKPGASAQNSQTKQAGAGKGISDKASLVAKSPAPAPSKSPWATLPPVDKASPVQINPPVQQQQQTRFAQRDSYGSDALPPMSSPAAKEIAADDFSRTWRDERGNKELFNSQSGRYEPVNETRRGSIRDTSYRQPSVLQRPHAGPGPAEPSAAFQTSRAGVESGSWTRRRTSSNVSGGSGRRMSFTRQHDSSFMPGELAQRRGSQSIAVSDSLQSGDGYRSTHGQQRNQVHEGPGGPQGNWTQRASPATSQAQPVSPYESVASTGAPETVEAAVPAPDPVVIQQQVMKDNIERAREAKRRRDEEEAKAEAAKKERIEKLMAKLGPASKPDSVAAPESQTAKDKPASLPSPPKPPVPTTDGEVTRYGMIKMHSSHTVKKPSPPMEHHVPALNNTGAHGSPSQSSEAPARSTIGVNNSTSPAQTHIVKSIPEAGSQVQKAAEGHAPRANQLTSTQTDLQSTWKQQQPPQPSPESFQPWNNSLASHTQPLSSSSVWGPPSKGKSLGNGTFATDFNAPHPRHASQPVTQASQVVPGPIAPPLKYSPVPSHALPSHEQQQQRAFVPQPDIRLPPIAPIGASPTSQTTSQSTAPGPIGPPGKNMQGSRFSVGDWSTLAKNPAQHDAGLFAARSEVLKKHTGMTAKFDETFKQTEVGRLGERRVVKTEQRIHDNGLPGQAPSSELAELGTHLGGQVVPGSQAAQPVGKSSRFFPTAQGSRATSAVVGNLAVLPDSVSDSSDGPPPPDTLATEHPAFDGALSRPKVNLPLPKAVVKLPPAPPSPPKAVVMPARPQSVRIGSQPIVSQTAWQDRFNGLFGKAGKVSPPQQHASPAAVVSSASKAPLEVASQRSSATVSLPVNMSQHKRKALFSNDSSSSIVSKQSAEEALLDDREFGSLPVVHVSKPDHNADAIKLPPPGDVGNIRSRAVDSTSAHAYPFNMHYEVKHEGFAIQICIPNSKRGKTERIMLRNRSRKTSSYQGNKKRNHPRGENVRGEPSNASQSNPRSRKSAHMQGSTSGTASSPRTSSHNNSTWRNEGTPRPTSAHNNSWQKRASPGVVH